MGSGYDDVSLSLVHEQPETPDEPMSGEDQLTDSVASHGDHDHIARIGPCEAEPCGDKAIAALAPATEDNLTGRTADWLSIQPLSDRHEDWQLDEDSPTIGSASKFGRVVPASHPADPAAAATDGGQWVAKVCQLNEHTGVAFAKDAYFLTKLQGTGLVPRLATQPWRCEDTSRGYIIMERLAMDARQFIYHQQHQQHQQHSGGDTRDIPDWLVRGMATALTDLSRHGIVHGDVKASNFVLTEDQQVRLIDFGHATDFEHFPPSPFIIGSTLLWRTEDGRPVKLMLDGEPMGFDEWLNLWALEVNLLCYTRATQTTVAGQPFAGFDLPFNRDQFNNMCIAVIVQDNSKSLERRQYTLPTGHYPWELHRQQMLAVGHMAFALPSRSHHP